MDEGLFWVDEKGRVAILQQTRSQLSHANRDGRVDMFRAYGTWFGIVLIPWVETHGYKIGRADGPFCCMPGSSLKEAQPSKNCYKISRADGPLLGMVDLACKKGA